MTRKRGLRRARKRQSYSREFRQEAVQMVLDGHSVTSVADRLGAVEREPFVSLEEGGHRPRRAGGAHAWRSGRPTRRRTAPRGART